MMGGRRRLKKSVCLNVCSSVKEVRICRSDDAYEHFTNKVARSEANDEADEHASDDGDERLVDCTDAFDLEVVGGP